MDLKKLLDGIQSHPVVVAIIIFVGVFLLYNATKKTGAPTLSAIGDAGVPRQPQEIDVNITQSQPQAIPVASSTATATTTPHACGKGGIQANSKSDCPKGYYFTRHANGVGGCCYPNHAANHDSEPSSSSGSSSSSASLLSSTTAYHGVLQQHTSTRPANIGPWISGRQVMIHGHTYVIKTGPNGRLWGDMIGGPKDILLWDGAR